MQFDKKDDLYNILSGIVLPPENLTQYLHFLANLGPSNSTPFSF